MSHAYWQRHLGGDPGIVGRSLVISATPFTVVGVAPPEFTGLSVGVQPDLWAPMAMNRFDVSLQGYDEERGRLFLDQVLERVGAVPGIDAATVASAGPLSFTLMRSVFPEGREGEKGTLIQVNSVAPGYFETLRIPVVRGRAFAETDREGALPVVVVNETMAETFWPGQDPVGRRFRFFGDPFLVEVVGVARNVKYNSLGEDPQPYVYQPLRQAYSGSVTLVARAATEPAAALLPIQRELNSLQRDMPLVGSRPSVRC